jgi:ABC-type uncharacterized transport system permease subunit
MTFTPNATLYLALGLYALGTLAAFAALFTRIARTQHVALGLMIAGFVAHTFWIGSICVRTHHPPITNLPEAASFLAWCIFAFELVILLRYRVHAASFFVYPLVLILLTISAVIREPFALMNPALRSGLFTTHVLLTTIGVAGLLIALSFIVLSQLQDRSLKLKTRGPLWEWIPSLNVCNVVTYVWSYRTSAALMDLRVKQIGALVAWVLFAVLLQSYVSGGYRARRTLFISAGAFVAILIALLGIHHA